jgi:hypothetical protein
MHKFFASRAGMRPEDSNNRNPQNLDNGSNLNWRGIFLFVVYTSVVLGFFLFSRNRNYKSVGSGNRRISLPLRYFSVPRMLVGSLESVYVSQGGWYSSAGLSELVGKTAF